MLSVSSSRKVYLTIFLAILTCVAAYAIGGTAPYSFIARFLFVLFLPGFSIIRAIAGNHFRLSEKLILAPVIGLGYTELISLYLSTLHITINQYSIAFSVLAISTPLLFYSYKKHGFRVSIPSFSKNKSYLVLLALIGISIIFISLPWSKNGIAVPMGDDPITSTLASTLIAQQGAIPQSWAPYYPEQTTFAFSPGYPSVIAAIYLLDSSVPMPALVCYFAVFFALIFGQIFIITRRIFNNYKIAIVATGFSVFLSTGFYQMAIYGRFPAMVGLALTLNLMLFLYLFSTTKKTLFVVLSALTFGSLILTYTVSLITAGLFVLLFGVLTFILKRNGRIVVGTFLSIVLGTALTLPWVINVVQRITIPIPLREYSQLLTWYDASSVHVTLGSNSILLWGYWLALFSFAVVLTVSFIKDRRTTLFLAWFLSIFLLIVNELARIKIPEWYYLQTDAFLNPLVSLPIAVLLGISVATLYPLMVAPLQRLTSKSLRKISPLIIIAICIIPLCVGANIILSRTDYATCRFSVSDNLAMNWLTQNTTKDSIVYNDHWIGTASTWIPVISHRQIIMPTLSISEIGWSELMLTRQDESLVVAKNPDSTDALSILQKYNVSYIYLSNYASPQVEKWRDNYNISQFSVSKHYEIVFNREDAWIIRVLN